MICNWKDDQNGGENGEFVKFTLAKFWNLVGNSALLYIFKQIIGSGKFGMLHRKKINPCLVTREHV